MEMLLVIRKAYKWHKNLHNIAVMCPKCTSVAQFEGRNAGFSEVFARFK